MAGGTGVAVPGRVFLTMDVVFHYLFNHSLSFKPSQTIVWNEHVIYMPILEPLFYINWIN